LNSLRIGAKVRIEGEKGSYVVVRVDPERYLADLLLVTGKKRLETNVPLTSIRLTDENGPFRIEIDKIPCDAQTAGDNSDRLVAGDAGQPRTATPAKFRTTTPRTGWPKKRAGSKTDSSSRYSTWDLVSRSSGPETML